MAEVFLCQTGQLTPTSRRDLKKAGVVVVEVEDPNACQFIKSSEVISHDDMLWACVDALNVEHSYSGKNHERLAKNLLRIIMASRTPKAVE